MKATRDDIKAGAMIKLPKRANPDVVFRVRCYVGDDMVSVRSLADDLRGWVSLSDADRGDVELVWAPA
jgi:hypothetical protein